MNKNTFTTIPLSKGEIHLYELGALRLHAYRTDDPMNDEVYILEREGAALLLEPPCFRDNIRALTDYLANLRVEGILVAYHGAGASLLPGTARYATQNAADFSAAGGGKALIDGFAAAFGESFDASLQPITRILEAGRVTLAGIDLVIRPTAEAYDIEIPAIRALYTHMLGHDCHSIVGGPSHADSMIASLEEAVSEGFELILTSHYTPEDLKDVRTKIDYLKVLKELAASCPDAGRFKEEAQRRFPHYKGLNYLQMTADSFYPPRT